MCCSSKQHQAAPSAALASTEVVTRQAFNTSKASSLLRLEFRQTSSPQHCSKFKLKEVDQDNSISRSANRSANELGILVSSSGTLVRVCGFKGTDGDAQAYCPNPRELFPAVL